MGYRGPVLEVSASWHRISALAIPPAEAYQGAMPLALQATVHHHNRISMPIAHRPLLMEEQLAAAWSSNNPNEVWTMTRRELISC
jgi:hypothetical protein